MYGLLSTLLSDKKGDVIFECFGVFHIIYMVLILGAIAAAVIVLRKKDEKTRQRAVSLTASVAFFMYIADFFSMPFAYGEIDLEKLPFHACTAMCVMCFLCRRNSLLGKFKAQFVLLGLISNLVYVIYPAGVGWYAIHPLSYRVVQTLLFHGIMTAQGILALALGDVKLEWKTAHKHLALTVCMTAWALLGNVLYNGAQDRNFNWFFVTQDPFYILPKSVAPYVMPFIVIAAFFAVQMLAHAIYFGIMRLKKQQS